MGAGFGGLLTAIKVARTSVFKEVVLIDQNERHVHTPWLYEVVTGGMDDDSQKKEGEIRKAAGLSIRKIADRVPGLRFKKKKIVSCDFKGRQVVFDDGKTLKYDQAVVALGMMSHFFGIEGAEKHAFPIKSLEGSLALRRELMGIVREKRAEIVIVGAGATGVETAGELANFLRRYHPDYSAQIMLMEAEEDILMRFPRALRRNARKRLEALGVQIATRSKITCVKAKKVELAGKEAPEVKFDMLIWAAGAKPCDAAHDMSLPKDLRGKIRVLPTLQVEGHPDVYAIGDIISWKDQSGRYAPSASWAAIAQAGLLARNFSRKHPAHYSLPKHFPALIAVGGKYAVGTVGGVSIKGRLGYIVRRAADLNYFRKILPFFQAFRHWWRALRLFAQND